MTNEQIPLPITEQPTINVEELRQRILGVHAGLLPQDSYTKEEVAAALKQVRADRKSRIANGEVAKSTAKIPKQAAVQQLDISQLQPGGLLAMLAGDVGE